MTVRKKAVFAGLLVSLMGSGLAWATFGSKPVAEGTRTVVLSEQDIETTGARIALFRWREYMRDIGWPEHLVQRAHPEFVNAATSKERLTDGGWKLVFDGTSPGELRIVRMQLDDRGNEVGETYVEWSDFCTVADFQGGHGHGEGGHDQ